MQPHAKPPPGRRTRKPPKTLTVHGVTFEKTLLLPAYTFTTYTAEEALKQDNDTQGWLDTYGYQIVLPSCRLLVIPVREIRGQGERCSVRTTAWIAGVTATPSPIPDRVLCPHVYHQAKTPERALAALIRRISNIAQSHQEVLAAVAEVPASKENSHATLAPRR